jgi:hypothetical protein
MGLIEECDLGQIHIRDMQGLEAISDGDARVGDEKAG